MDFICNWLWVHLVIENHDKGQSAGKRMLYGRTAEAGQKHTQQVTDRILKTKRPHNSVAPSTVLVRQPLGSGQDYLQRLGVCSCQAPGFARMSGGRPLPAVFEAILKPTGAPWWRRDPRGPMLSTRKKFLGCSCARKVRVRVYVVNW